MDNTINSTKEFEVTGVSRSGRVRKKSSKLLDFRSPDEVEKKIKRSTLKPAVKYSGRGRPSLATLRARRSLNATLNNDESFVENSPENDKDEISNEDEGEDINVNSTILSEDEELDLGLGDSSGLVDDIPDSDDDGFGELVADFVEGEAQHLDSNTGQPDSTVRQSLYMSENNTKRKDGRLERKDKGKARYTAYSLWAREMRKSTKLAKNQELDFSNAAKRLSELWANVSNREKNAWRRKAKLQAARAKAQERAGLNSPEKMVAAIDKTQQVSSFINRPTTSRTKKLAEDKLKAKDEVKTSISPVKRRRSLTGRRSNNITPNCNESFKNSLSYITNGANLSPQETNAVTTVDTTNSTQVQIVNNNKLPLPNTEPIDAAAHLKLLGESLTIIGERLKEHDGQIAICASLSVLLDSLLCSLGPLLCLTTRLPGFDKKTELQKNLSKTLDNIAYVMPGL